MDAEPLEALADAFVRIAGGARPNGPLPLLELACGQVAGCDWASITTIAAGRATTLAATDDRARAADEVQHRLGAGPCMQAARSRAYHTIFTVDEQLRWPGVAAGLRERTPVRSVLAVHMLEDEPTSLNLYAGRRGGFDEPALTLAAVIAGQLATMLSSRRPEARLGELREALDSRREVEVAVAVLTCDGAMSEADAVAALYRASRRLHRPLRALAREVVATGALPGS